MFDWNNTVDKRFAKKQSKEVTLDTLFESAFSQLKSKLLLEKRYLLNEEQALKFSAIPEISVSELGWSAVETKETGEVVSSEQRTQLEQYLRNIGGNSFEEKIKRLSDFYNMSPEAVEDSPFLQSESNSSKIQKVISYLVFYKTLTTIVTNFNAASAGFSFESFLAVLLGGKQVPTASGTIADFYDSEGTPLSLKLYAESTVEVGGSFKDLVGDLVNPKPGVKLKEGGIPFVRYLVCTKSLQGKGLQAEGKISIYQFDFDLNNVFDFMARSSNHNRKLVQIPLALMKNPDSEAFEGEAEAGEEVTDKVAAGIPQAMSDLASEMPEQFKQQLQQVPADQLAQYFQTIFGQSEYGKPNREVKKLKKTPLTQLASQLLGEEVEVTPEMLVELGEFLVKVHNYAVEESKAQKGYASTAASVKFYEQADVELKKKILLNCYGFTSTSQFGMRMTGVQTLTGGKEPNVGVIVIGRKNIEETLNKCVAMLNTSIFDIFENLKELTSNINGYVASGLTETEKAEQAQEAAKNIDKKTEEIKSETT
jgi:hypothetical protein